MSYFEFGRCERKYPNAYTFLKPSTIKQCYTNRYGYNRIFLYTSIKKVYNSISQASVLR